MKPDGSATARYPIRAVARMTGLSADTLRAWERRYEAVAPGRSRRGRLYTDAQVARLRQLADLVGRGGPRTGDNQQQRKRKKASHVGPLREGRRPHRER